MKIFSAAQIRAWDSFTIQHEPVSSINLMERAAAACYGWIIKNYPHQQRFIFFCGNGNNGGDGLAIARMLYLHGKQVEVFLLPAEKRSADCMVNMERLTSIGVQASVLSSPLPTLLAGSVIIDALFGTGLNKAPDKAAAALIDHINQSNVPVISIDLPSGMFADYSSTGNAVVNATHTLSFQCTKLAFLFAENAKFTGTIHLLDIGLSDTYYESTETKYRITDQQLIRSIYKPRKAFSHKYHFGHALLFAGSRNMMGAAVLCARACLRSGVGLVTVHCEENGMTTIQSALPEAICNADTNIEQLLLKKAAVGLGPGLAFTHENGLLTETLLRSWSGPLVVDASGLHLLKPLLPLLKQRTHYPAIITPHTGEFEMLFGKSSNDFGRMQLAIEKAATLHCYILLKGKNSMIVCPDGKVFFNSTGNSGMATAGSGDVLTGIITGLTAQGYNAEESCLLGAYLHGLAGDLAAEKNSQEAMIAGDITEQLGTAFKTLQQ